MIRHQVEDNGRELTEGGGPGDVGLRISKVPVGLLRSVTTGRTNHNQSTISSTLEIWDTEVDSTISGVP